MESLQGGRSSSRILPSSSSSPPSSFPSSSSPPPLGPEDEELFHKYFDWNSYAQAAQPVVGPYTSSTLPDFPNFSNWQPPADNYPVCKDLAANQSYSINAFSLESLQSDFYRMNASFHAEDEEAPSPPSDCSTTHSPPELVPAGSTSPSDHSGSPSVVSDASLDAHHARVALHEVRAHDDEWTYPQHPHHPCKHLPVGYPSHIRVHDATSPDAVAAVAGLKRRRSQNEVDKRHRQLIDPLQTADVRKSGACVPCRVSKIRCHESGVCPTCRKAFPNHSHLVCSRATPGMAGPVIGKIPDIWSADASEEESLCNGPRFPTGKPRAIVLYLTNDSSSSPLEVVVQAYHPHENSSDSSVRLADFPLDKVPSYEQLQGWVEGEIKHEHTTKFKYALQSFLLAYHKDGHGLPRVCVRPVSSVALLPANNHLQHRLVTNVHKLNCFFRIWKTESFWCLDPTKKFVNLPLSVRARLRKIAQCACRSIEHDILKELDDILAQQGRIKPDEQLAIWASLWQLLLMYRETLACFKKHMVCMAQYANKHDSIATEHGRVCCWMQDSVFPLMATFHHYQFRTRKSLEMSLDWLTTPKYPSHACKSKCLQITAKHLFESRKDFYNRVLASSHEIDVLLAVLVVKHESNKLNARRRNTKSSQSKVSRRGDDDCDDDE